jgi:putative molybdopterin biosynthesis protein
MNTTFTPSELLTVRELQQLLKIGRNKVYELLRSGEIPCVRLGKQIRIRRVDVEVYIKPK